MNSPEQQGLMRFPILAELPGVVHGFVLREPGLDVACEKEEALRRLEPTYCRALTSSGIERGKLVLCEQVHGAEVAVVGVQDVGRIRVPGVDALVTADEGVALGIHVADCCPVYLVDAVRRVIALAHSGRKGTGLGIARACIRTMSSQFGCNPAEMTAVLGPCIRPPLYEEDFAAGIVRQCLEEGVGRVSDCGLCTGSDLGRFYSYRVERGLTGRMLAFLMLRAADS